MRFLFRGLAALGLAGLNSVCLAQPAEMGEIGDVARNELGQNNAPYVQTFGNMDGTSAGIIFHQAISVIAASNS